MRPPRRGRSASAAGFQHVERRPERVGSSRREARRTSGRASRTRQRWGHALLVVLGIGLAIAGPRPASGRERPQVALVLDDCVAVEHAQVRHLLSLELGGPLCEGAPPAGVTRAAVTCSPPPVEGPLPAADPRGPPPAAAVELVELRVDDAVTGKSLWRHIELHQTDPGVRARLLALALSELIFASWAELLVIPKPAVPAAAAAASAATRQATSVQVERKLARPLPPLGIQLSGLGAAYVQWGEPSLAFGGGARVTGDHGHHLGWDLDLLLHHGETPTALGIVTRDLLSARATLLLHHRVPHLTLRGGLGGRIGTARLAGEPADPRTIAGATLWAPWGGPLLTLGLSAAAARLRLDLSVEAGYVVSPVAARVGGVRAVAVEGTWFGIQVGLGSWLR